MSIGRSIATAGWASTTPRNKRIGVAGWLLAAAIVVPPGAGGTFGLMSWGPDECDEAEKKKRDEAIWIAFLMLMREV